MSSYIYTDMYKMFNDVKQETAVDCKAGLQGKFQNLNSMVNHNVDVRQTDDP